VGIKLGVVVCDMSDIGKTGKANSFIRLWLRQSRVITVSAAQSNSQQFSAIFLLSTNNSKTEGLIEEGLQKKYH
jgi:hypothetical protein